MAVHLFSLSLYLLLFLSLRPFDSLARSLARLRTFALASNNIQAFTAMMLSIQPGDSKIQSANLFKTEQLLKCRKAQRKKLKPNKMKLHSKCFFTQIILFVQMSNEEGEEEERKKT